MTLFFFAIISAQQTRRLAKLVTSYTSTSYRLLLFPTPTPHTPLVLTNALWTILASRLVFPDVLSAGYSLGSGGFCGFRSRRFGFLFRLLWFDLEMKNGVMFDRLLEYLVKFGDLMIEYNRRQVTRKTEQSTTKNNLNSQIVKWLSEDISPFIRL